MKIKATLHWGLDKNEVDTELMPSRADWRNAIKTEGSVILATFGFPKGVEYDLEFTGGSLRLQKYVDEEARP